MTFQAALFIVLVFTTFFNNGVQAYIHYEAYPLLAFVGKAEFPTYLKEYENRLTLPLVAPYILTLLSNLILIFTRPAAMSVIWVIIAFLLNLSVSVVTMQVATPVYTKIKQAGQTSPPEMSELMRINLIRLVLSTVASVVVIILMFSVVTG